MSTPVSTEDWDALLEVLADGLQQLAGRSAGTLKRAILEFSSTAAMLGLEDLARVAGEFESFLKETLEPAWDEEAATSLGFSMGALQERMRTHSYGPEFSAELDDALFYLRLYKEEDPFWESPALPEAAGLTVAAPAVEETVQSAELPTVSADVPDLPPPQSPVMPPAEADHGFVMDRVEWYREQLREEPASIVFVRLAEELCNRQQWTEAVEVCRSGLAFHPAHLRGRILLGWALHGCGSREAALEFLDGARADLEANALLYRILAEAADLDGRSDDAQRWMQTYALLEHNRTGQPLSLERHTPAVELEVAQPVVRAPASPPVITAPPVDPEPEPHPLERLLQGFERRRARSPVIPALFAADDRASLIELLRMAVA